MIAETVVIFLMSVVSAYAYEFGRVEAQTPRFNTRTKIDQHAVVQMRYSGLIDPQRYFVVGEVKLKEGIYSFRAIPLNMGPKTPCGQVLDTVIFKPLLRALIWPIVLGYRLTHHHKVRLETLDTDFKEAVKRSL